MYLAENLKFLREQNGKTQGELAVLFGIEQKTISSWECGSRKPPIGTIVSLAKLYRVYEYSLNKFGRPLCMKCQKGAGK